MINKVINNTINSATQTLFESKDKILTVAKKRANEEINTFQSKIPSPSIGPKLISVPATCTSPVVVISPLAFISFTAIVGEPYNCPAYEAESAVDDEISFVISTDADNAKDAVTSNNGTNEPVPSASCPLEDICNTL